MDEGCFEYGCHAGGQEECQRSGHMRGWEERRESMNSASGSVIILVLNHDRILRPLPVGGNSLIIVRPKYIRC